MKSKIAGERKGEGSRVKIIKEKGELVQTMRCIECHSQEVSFICARCGSHFCSECADLFERKCGCLPETIYSIEGLKTVGLKMNPGLDTCLIDLIQSIEKELDGLMVKNGFARSETSKSGESVIFLYKQFGISH